MVTRNDELGKMRDAVLDKVADGLVRDVTAGVEATVGVEAPEPFDELTGPLPPSNTREPSGKDWVKDLGLSVKELGRAERDIEVGRVIKELAEANVGCGAYARGYAAALSDVASRLFPPEATSPRLCEHCGVNAPVDDPLGRCPECLRRAGEYNDRKFRFESEART